jgi:mono/diheme cytochrome c family protein
MIHPTPSARHVGLARTLMGAATLAAAVLSAPTPLTAQSHEPGQLHQPHLVAAADFGIDPAAVTFNRDIAPIFARSCIGCHRAGGAGPMALTSYQEARRYAQRIKDRTAIRDRMGAMPPWYVEKDIGIQHYKQDPSLTDEELAKIQAWVDNGAPEGNARRTSRSSSTPGTRTAGGSSPTS